MSSERSSWHLPLKIALRALINVGLVWFLAEYFDEYLILTGGIAAYVVVGSLLTLMNLFIRPLLNILSIPIRLVATLIGIILVNGIFLWLITFIADRMDPSILTLDIRGGIGGWIVLMLILGLANWLQKLLIR